MSTGIRRPHAMALADAERFRAMFDPGTYERWQFAGSLRRRKPEIGDVEHVIIPRLGEVERGGGLFATRETVNLVFDQLDELVANGTVTKHVYGDTGFRWGSLYRGVDYLGFLHEIWCADADNFGCKLLIRTGPDTYSKRFMVALNAAAMYRQKDGDLIHIASGEPVKVPDEETYCRLAGVPLLAPEART